MPPGGLSRGLPTNLDRSSPFFDSDLQSDSDLAGSLTISGLTLATVADPGHYRLRQQPYSRPTMRP
jgi:hypothetical protein